MMETHHWPKFRNRNFERLWLDSEVTEYCFLQLPTRPASYILASRGRKALVLQTAAFIGGRNPTEKGGILMDDLGND